MRTGRADVCSPMRANVTQRQNVVPYQGTLQNTEHSPKFCVLIEQYTLTDWCWVC